jgi:flagellar protein FliS
MVTASNREKQYLLQRVQAASPLELIRILYEAAIQAVDGAQAALHSGEIMKRGEAVNKAIEILSELQVSLRRDVEPEYSNALAELYTYMQQQLLRAHTEQSEKVLQEVSRLLQTLLEGWNGAIENLAALEPKQTTEPAAKAPGEGQTSPFFAGASSAQPQARSWQL